jgi:cytochrome b561
MQLRNSPDRWGAVAQLLHWSMAALVISLVLLGLFMTEMPNSMDKLKLYALHKSLGLTVLALVILRLLWRLAGRRPAWPPHIPRWQRRLAGITHGLLYLLLLWMPLSGWLYNSASNFPLRWFNQFRVPALTGPDPELKALALAMHSWGFYLLAALFVLHAGAALKHHYHDRDRTLTAMLPFSKR